MHAKPIRTSTNDVTVDMNGVVHQFQRESRLSDTSLQLLFPLKLPIRQKIQFIDLKNRKIHWLKKSAHIFRTILPEIKMIFIIALNDPLHITYLITSNVNKIQKKLRVQKEIEPQWFVLTVTTIYFSIKTLITPNALLDRLILPECNCEINRKHASRE